MRHQSVILPLIAIIVSFVDAARDIVPSIEVCATFPNEEFLVDLEKCQNTCEFYGRNWNCPNYYKPKGDCYCKEGFARIALDGKCVSVAKNTKCAAQLPIQPESCAGPNEGYSDAVVLNGCGDSCRRYGCHGDGSYENNYEKKWSPNCKCSNEKYKRLSNGTCVPMFSDECVDEFQPSPERCAALGQTYKLNAPCQEACYNKSYCPPAGGACVCPSNKIPNTYRVMKQEWLSGSYEENSIEIIDCYNSKNSCPIRIIVAGR